MRNPTVEFWMNSAAGKFRNYADHIGFFRYTGFDRGEEPRNVAGSSNYIPIHRFSIQELQAKAAGKPYGEIVNEEASTLASIITRAEDGPTFDVVQYAFREVMRNSVEHSRGSNLTVFGQFWPANNKAEIVILDDGVGILENLLEHEYVECSNDLEAIKCALLPGVSGVTREERMKQDETWGNSGFGLYVLSRLCAENGLFRVITGNGALTLKGEIQESTTWSYPGTCIQLIFSGCTSMTRKNRIPQIIGEGEMRRMDIMDKFPIEASMASKMLASDFIKKRK